MKNFDLQLTVIVFFTSILLYGCSKKDNITELPKTESARVQQQLEKIMSTETIGIQRAFFEKAYGPAKRSLGNVLNYEVGTCSVNIVYDKDNSIISVELDGISKICNFNGKNIHLNSMADQINYSELIKVAMDWNADLSCYTMCGNAADPVYGAFFETPRVYGFIQFDATTDYLGSEKASDNVEKYFKMKYPSVDLIGGDIGSIPKDEYNKIWFENFKDVKLTSIKFGYNLKK
jgi:hypothetical protein